MRRLTAGDSFRSSPRDQGMVFEEIVNADLIAEEDMVDADLNCCAMLRG